jgi:hypothetical protein
MSEDMSRLLTGILVAALVAATPALAAKSRPTVAELEALHPGLAAALYNADKVPDCGSGYVPIWHTVATKPYWGCVTGTYNGYDYTGKYRRPIWY